MQDNNIKLKYSTISLLSLVIVSCGLNSKKERHSETFDGSNFLTINKDNAHIYNNLYDELKNNRVIKMEAEHSSEDLRKLYDQSFPVRINEKDHYLYEKDGELKIIVASNPSSAVDKKVGELILEDLRNSLKQKHLAAKKAANKQRNNELQSSSVTVSLFEENLSCFMPESTENDQKLIDYCNKNANVKLHFKVDMSGSRKGEFSANSEKVKTEEGKFITFSISPKEEGGTGWHIADSISQNYSKYGDKISPIANKYYFAIMPEQETIQSKNHSVDLVHTFPLNLNPKTSITENRGYNFGLSGGLKTGIKSELKPAVSPLSGFSLGEIEANLSGDFSANILHTNSRTVQFETHEYTVENNSNANKAIWIWDAKIPENICTYLTNYDSYNCSFSTLPWNTRWAANINKFSAISHKSFTPAFQAIYKTSKENKGTAQFELFTKAQTAVIFGNISQYFVKKSYQLSTGVGEILVPPVTVTVNWNSPFFASEENVRLQKTQDLMTTLCLTAQDIANPVTLENCSNTHAQIWGYDIETKQVKSRIGNNNLCLALQRSETTNSTTFIAITEPCSANKDDKVVKNNQIWELTTEGFIKATEDPEQRVLNLTKNHNLILAQPDQSTPKFKAYDAKL